MRWLKSFVFIGLMALVVSETPEVIVRAPRFRQSLVKLAVQPTSLEVDPVAVAAVQENSEEVAPVATGRRIMPYGGPQYWPGYNAQSWYGYNPYWATYGQMPPRRWAPRRYWGPRVAIPAVATTVAPVSEVETVPEEVVSTDVQVEAVVPQLA